LLYVRAIGTLAAMRTLLVLAVCACSHTPAAAPGDDDPPGDDPDDPGDGAIVPGGPSGQDSPHLALGVPADGSPGDDFLIVHPEMAIGYNHFLNAANWVSWRTRRIDFGPAPRYAGPFYPEAALPAAWFHPDTGELSGSGYDRGHMLRSEERTRDDAANYATFVMSNVLPQRPDLNRGPWFDFELYVQRKIESTSHPRDAYVIAGAVWPAACATHAARVAGDGCPDVGRSTDPTHRIAVPSATWKVVVFVDPGEDPRAALHPYIAGVLMPNTNGIAAARWYTYRATVAEIEAASGYDLPSLE
jgi:endonuclease G, mitochondrial